MARDGLSLTLGAVVTSGIGMLAWVVAARMLPSAAVGHASAFVSGLLLVAGVGDLGIGGALMRWGPRAGSLRARLLLRSYSAVVVVSVVAVVVVLLLPTGAQITAAIPRLGGELFLLAAVGWALFQFQDNVLVSLGLARWVPVENGGMGVARVGILVTLGPLLGALGVLLSWLVPALCGVVVISVLIWRRLTRKPAADVPVGTGALPTRREVVGLLAPTYPAKVAGGLLSDLVPLLVITRFGAAAGAVFFVVWMAGNAVNYAATNFAQSLAIRIAHEPDRTGPLFAASCKRLAVLFVPALLLAIVLAHPLLSIFGATYAAQGTLLLRLVLLGCVPRLLTTLVTAAFLAHGRGIAVGALEAGSALGVVAFVAVIPASGLGAIGAGFVAVELLLACAAAAGLHRRLRHRQADQTRVGGSQ